MYSLAKSYLVKLLQYSFVKSLTYSVGLWRSDLGLRVLDVVNGQIQLIVVAYSHAAIFRDLVCQNPQ